MQGLNLQKYKIQLAIFKFSKHANSDLGIDDDICSNSVSCEKKIYCFTQPYTCQRFLGFFIYN